MVVFLRHQTSFGEEAKYLTFPSRMWLPRLASKLTVNGISIGFRRFKDSPVLSSKASIPKSEAVKKFLGNTSSLVGLNSMVNEG